MPSEIINIGLALLEGFALIISPCILPVLPLIFAGSIEGSKRRPIGILIGFIISFALFTFFARKLVTWFNIDLDLIRYVSFSILILLGLIMVSNYLTEKFDRLTAGFANLGTSLTQKNSRQDLIGGIGFGALIGLIWTPCAGPILAAVIVQSILQESSIASFFTIMAFGIGVTIPIAALIFCGRSILNKLNFLQRNSELIRKILGVIIILAVVGMLFGTPYLESSNTKSDAKDITGTSLQNGLIMPYQAPPIADISAWINSAPLQLEQLRGKVVLIDFWAYSCINCVRTLPSVLDWYDKYHDQGLIIIGVHSPEFDFERDEENVRKAVERYGIKYPVALDNNFATWKNYQNRFWPAHYLIDKNGQIVYTHFGEGAYSTTENNIRYLLGIKSEINTKDSPSTRFNPQTPETYLGYSRIDDFASPEKIADDAVQRYSYPATLAQNSWALSGKWTIAYQKIISKESNAAIKIHFYAKNVYVVMGSSDKEIEVKVLLNGKLIEQNFGSDVLFGIINVKDHTLYNAINSVNVQDGELELIANKTGLEVYTFTFSN